MILEEFKKICKSKIFIAIVSFIIGGAVFGGNNNQDQLDKYNAKLLTQKQTIEKKDTEISKLNDSLSETNEKAKEYLSLNTNEKNTIDEKIVEVKQNTIDEKNKAKVEEEERKRQEEERKNQEEQLKIQQEQQAKEEQERQAQAEQAAQVNNNVDTNNNQEQLVWVTATGSKYHSKPNCGNSKTSTQVSLSEAQSRGLDACKNCN